MKSNNLEKIVLEILEESEQARTDDMRLYFDYINKVNTTMVLHRIFMSAKYRKQREIASFQTIERIGRKLRKEHPELNPKAKQKLEMTENYIDYSFGRNVEIY